MTALPTALPVAALSRPPEIAGEDAGATAPLSPRYLILVNLIHGNARQLFVHAPVVHSEEPKVTKNLPYLLEF